MRYSGYDNTEGGLPVRAEGAVDREMLDLHCHILPGVDDGPTTLAEALALARFCVADGITHVTATPHCHPCACG